LVGAKTLAFNAAAILIGVLGGLSAVVTLFVDTDSKVSIKWLLLIILISITLLVIVMKYASDISAEKNSELKFYEKPIGKLASEQVLVIRVNPLFNYHSLVGGYLVNDEIETIAFIGYVFHIQEKMSQIKIINVINSSGINFFDADVLSKIIIRPVIPFAVMKSIEAINE